MAGHLWLTALLVVTFTLVPARVEARFDEKDIVIEKLQESILALNQMLIRQDTTINELNHKLNILESKMILLEDTNESSESKATKILTEKTASDSVAKRHAGTANYAFFASTSHNIGNLGAFQHIIFDHVITNEGYAYNPTHGSFTAPVNGIYVFSATILSYKNEDIHCRLLKNGGLVVHLYADGRGEAAYDTAAGDMVLHLNAGDTIAIDNQNQGKNLFGDNYSFFSGFLLKQL